MPKRVIGPELLGTIAAQTALRAVEWFCPGHLHLVPGRPARDKWSMDARSAFRSAAGLAIDYALPPRCPSCGTTMQDDDGFCLTCWNQLDHLDGGCICCGDPAIAGRDAGALCAACIADPPPFETMRAAVAYGEIARSIALRLKYSGRIGLARLIAKAMARHLRELEDALIVPVPLHRRRIWRRGYNQAGLIATALARQCAMDVDLAALRRHRSTPILRGLGREARRKAVRGAFSVPESKRQVLKGREIVLIDDVYTSGTTASACARILNRHGAGPVHVRTWARVSSVDDVPAY